VEVRRETVGLNPDADFWFDASAFEHHLDAGELDAALDLYRGDFLAGFTVDSAAFETWATRERERLRLAAMDALDRQIARLMEQGDYRAGIAAATRLLDMDNLREETHCQMMRLLALSDQRGKALDQYETCRRLLQDELGVEPTLRLPPLREDQVR
jgi:DNA-binding SARP family transcriptional activator